MIHLDYVIGIGTISSNYERGNYETLDSVGSGYQYFHIQTFSFIKYTTAGIDQQLKRLKNKIHPVVKGSIIDGYVYEGGTGYGLLL